MLLLLLLLLAGTTTVCLAQCEPGQYHTPTGCVLCPEGRYQPLGSLAPDHSLWGPPTNPGAGGLCEGDCDNDDECAGDLRCWHRESGDNGPVPGCAGTAESASMADGGWDYCYDPSDAITESSCISCEAGRHGTEARSSCQACDVGRYNSQPEARSEAYCLLCEPGQYSSETRTSCETCRIGAFTAESDDDLDGTGVFTRAGACNDCPAQTYKSSEDMCGHAIASGVCSIPHFHQELDCTDNGGTWTLVVDGRTPQILNCLAGITSSTSRTGTVSVRISINTALDGEQISWNIDSNSTTAGSSYTNDAEFHQIVDLDVGEHTINLFDSGRDGWGDRAFWTISDASTDPAPFKCLAQCGPRTYGGGGERLGPCGDSASSGCCHGVGDHPYVESEHACVCAAEVCSDPSVDRLTRWSSASALAGGPIEGKVEGEGSLFHFILTEDGQICRSWSDCPSVGQDSHPLTGWDARQGATTHEACTGALVEYTAGFTSADGPPAIVTEHAHECAEAVMAANDGDASACADGDGDGLPDCYTPPFSPAEQAAIIRWDTAPPSSSEIEHCYKIADFFGRAGCTHAPENNPFVGIIAGDESEQCVASTWLENDFVCTLGISCNAHWHGTEGTDFGDYPFIDIPVEPGQNCTCMSDETVPDSYRNYHIYWLPPGWFPPFPSDCSQRLAGHAACWVDADTCPDAFNLYRHDLGSPLLSFQACGTRPPTCDECTAMCAADPNCAAVDCFAKLHEGASSYPGPTCRWFANAQCDVEGMRLCQKGSYHACDGRVSADFGTGHTFLDDSGAAVSCAEAPIVEIVVSSSSLSRPPDYDGPMRIDASMTSPRVCQEICTASPECTHFSYATSWCYLKADYADPLCTASGYITSSSRAVTCSSSGEEIPSWQVNDGEAHCEDGSDEAGCVDASTCADDYIWRYSDRGDEYDCAAFVADPDLGVEACGESWAVGVDENGNTVAAYEACPVSCPLAASSSRGKHACGGQIGMDYGGNPTYTDSVGNEVSCGYAPWVGFISNSADWSPQCQSTGTPSFDVTFLGDSTDTSSYHRQVALNGQATVSVNGARFDGDGDYITILHFDYAQNGRFSISFWSTKEVCTGNSYEYLYSHHNNDNPLTQFDHAFINLYLGCEQAGGGYSSAGGTVIRYNLRDDAGSRAAFDFPLHAAGDFDSITNVWVHTVMVVHPIMVTTYDNGQRVSDTQYGFFNNGGASWMDDNVAHPTPSALSVQLTTLSLLTDIHLGGRADHDADRHFHGRIALVKIFDTGIDDTTANCLFHNGDAALLGQDVELTIDENMESPFDCQVLCHNDPECEYFSYEWELTSLQAPPPPPPALQPRLGVEYGEYTYSTIMPTDPDSESPLLCHGSNSWLPVPDGYELAPDTTEIIENVVAAHPWSTHVVVLASLRGYGTSAVLPGVEFGDHQDKAVSRIRDGEEQWSCPWTCYQILVRIRTSQIEPSTTAASPSPLAPTMIHKCYLKRPYHDANCNAVAFTPWADRRPDFAAAAAMVSMDGVARTVEVRIQGGGSRGVLEMNIDGAGWDAVCDDGFGAAEADVVCRQLGWMSGGSSYDTTHGDSTFSMDDLNCPSGAQSLGDCSTQRAPYTDDCGDHETVGIQCGTDGGETFGHRESGRGIACSVSGEPCTPPSLVDNGPDACLYPVYLSDAGSLDQSCGYSNNQVCTYHLTCSTGNPILTFLSFNTEANFDFVNVYDGADDTAPLVLRQDGTAIPSPVIGSGSQVTVELTTDAYVTRSGYTAEFSCGFCQERGRNFIIDSDDTSGADATCDDHLVDAVNPASPAVASLPDLPNELNTAAASIDLSPTGEALNPSNVEAPFDSAFFETTSFAGAFRPAPGRILCDPSPTCGPFISMAAEGTGSNRFIEIYNPTMESINLDEYGFPNTNDGADVDGEHDDWNPFTAGATIAPGDVYVVCHPNANPRILSVCDQLHQWLSSGDDGYCFAHGTEDDYQLVDCVGDFDRTDPVIGWDVCGVSDATQDHTLVRKCNTTFGNAGDWDSTTGTSSEDCQWIVEAEDYWETAGYHTHVCESGLADISYSWLDGWSWLDCSQGTLAGGYRDCTDPNIDLPDNFDSTACGEIETDDAWSGNVEMTCPVFVKDGATLTIAPGTTVYARTASSGYTVDTPCTAEACTADAHCIYVRNSASCQPLPSMLVIESGGTIHAAGTVTEPITFTVKDEMTSITERSVGQWGGIIILGNAPIYGGSRDIEILYESYVYGGDVAADSSGVLQYVRVWYAGASIAAGHKLAMTFGAVGSGTVVENCEVAMSAADGFEFLGGTVNAKRLSSIFVGGSAFDIEMGYTGKMQFLLGMLGIAGQHGCEVDGNADTTHSAESAPQVMGMTLVGSRDNEAADALILLREGTRGSFGNIVLHMRPGGDGIRIEQCYGTPSTQSLSESNLDLIDHRVFESLYVSASTIMYSQYDCPFIPPVITESGPGRACTTDDDDLRWLPVGSRAAVALCEPIRHKCLTCGEGHYTTNERFDQDGQGVETGATECIPCPEGKTNQQGDAHCEGCGAGSYTAGVSEGCLPCPVGTFNEVSDDSCEECPTDTFADEPGQPVCESCGNRCNGQGACQPDGSCACEPDSGFSGDFCEIFDPCGSVYSTECTEVHPARVCLAVAKADVEQDCVIAQLVTPAWTDGDSDDPMTPELPTGHPTTPAAEYPTLGQVCEAGLPAVIERTERWVQLAEDYLLQTAIDNSKLIAHQLCLEKRFGTLACLRSPVSVGTRVEYRSATTILAQLAELEQLRTRACDLLDVAVAAHRSGDLLQTTDVQPLSFQEYDATMDKLGDYITALHGRLENAATTAVHDLIAIEQANAEQEAIEEAQLWQEQVDEDTSTMESYKTQIQGLHNRIVDTLSALQLDGSELIATAEERNAAARNTFDAALSIAALSVEERATANAKLDALREGQEEIQGNLDTMREEHAAQQQQLQDQLDQMESSNAARHAEVTLQLTVMQEEDRSREQRLMGELTRLEEGQRRIQAQLARLPSTFEPSTCTASEQLAVPVANGCGNSITSIYHDLAAQAVQRNTMLSFFNSLSAITGYSVDGADDLRECCNDHDRCYGLCGHTQAFCDSELSTCMQDATSLPVGIGIGPTLLDVDDILQEFLGCPCYLQAQESYVAETHRGSEAQCVDSRLDVILREADAVCDVVLGVAASFVSGDALELFGVGDIVSDETQATIGQTITQLVQPIQDTINAIQGAIRSAFRARCVELTGRRLEESEREAICVNIPLPECDQLMVTLENTQAKIEASKAFVDTAHALFALNMQVLRDEDVDAAAVAEVDLRLLDLETLDDAVFVAGFQALISKTSDFAGYELDVRQVVSLLRCKMEQMRKFYEVAVSKREHEQQRDIYIRRAERARMDLQAIQDAAQQRLIVQRSINAKVTLMTRMSLTYLLRQIRAYEYAFVTEYPLDLGDLKASRKTGSQFYEFIQEQRANLAIAETDEASDYNHCGGQCLSWTQHDLPAGSAERDLFVQSGRLTVSIPLPDRTRFFAVRWIDVRVFLIGLNDPHIDLDIWQAGTSEIKGRDGTVRRFTHGAQSTPNGWTTPAYGFSYDGTSCSPRNSVSGLSDFDCIQGDGDSMHVRYSPYSTWTIQVLNHDQKPLELVSAVRFEFNLGEHHGAFDGEHIFFEDAEGARGCETMHSNWDTFSTTESCVARACAPVTSNPPGYIVANLGESTLGALGEVACAGTHVGRAAVSECVEAGGDFSFSGCTLIITGRCAGNDDPTEDTVCGTGFSAVPNSDLIEADGSHATCCNRVFCTAQHCPEGYVLRPLATTTLPAEGTPTSLPACCVSAGESDVGLTFAGMCVGNTDGDAEPDVVCNSPAQLRTNAAAIIGRDENVCCIVRGMCSDNSDGDTEPDIVCTPPARLRDDVATVAGRDQATCCITAGMCTGNSDRADDITCEDGMALVAGASSVVGTEMSECCEPLDICATVECVTPPKHSCLSGGLCRGGACQPLVAVPDGTPCDDMDSETMTDECHGQVCAGRVSLASTLTFGIDAAEVPLPGSEERAALNANIKAALSVSLQTAGMTSVSPDSISIVSIRLGSVVIDFSVAVPAAEASPTLRVAATEQIALSTVAIVIGGQTAQLSAAMVEPFKSYSWVKTEPTACDDACGMIDDSYHCFENGNIERPPSICQPIVGARPYTQTECTCLATILTTAAPVPEPTADPIKDLIEVAPAAGAGAGVLCCVLCFVCLVRSVCRKKKASLPTTSANFDSGVFSEHRLHEDFQSQQLFQSIQQQRHLQQQQQIQEQQKQLAEQQRKIEELTQMRNMRSQLAGQMAQSPTVPVHGNSSFVPSAPTRQVSQHRPVAQPQSTGGFDLGPEPRSEEMHAPTDPDQIAIAVGVAASLEKQLVDAGIPADAAAVYFTKLAHEGYDTPQLFNELSIDDLRDEFEFKRGHAMAVQKLRAHQP